MVYRFFDTKSFDNGVKSEILPNQELAEEIEKQIITKLEKRKVYSTCKENIWGCNFVDMQLISKYNKGFCFLLCFIDIYSKYAWVVSLKDKKDITITNAFQKILNEPNRKLNKMRVDKGSGLCNGTMKSWLQDNDIEIYSKGKFVAAERFIRTLKNKIYKYMTSISKNVYIDKLEDIVEECNKTYHITINMNSGDVKSSIYIDFNIEYNEKKIINLKLVIM